MLLVLPTSCPLMDTLLTVSTPSNHSSTYCLLNMSGVTIKYKIITNMLKMFTHLDMFNTFNL